MQPWKCHRLLYVVTCDSLYSLTAYLWAQEYRVSLEFSGGYPPGWQECLDFHPSTRSKNRSPSRGWSIVIACQRQPVVRYESLPQPQLQQAYTKAVDIMLHDIIFGNGSYTVWMLVKASFPGRFAFAQSSARGHSEAIKPNQEGRSNREFVTSQKIVSGRMFLWSNPNKWTEYTTFANSFANLNRSEREWLWFISWKQHRRERGGRYCVGIRKIMVNASGVDWEQSSLRWWIYPLQLRRPNSTASDPASRLARSRISFFMSPTLAPGRGSIRSTTSDWPFVI